MGDEEMPARLSRLWRLSTGSRLGRPAALDVDRVVRTAVELADRDGLAGVTLPKVAKELGVTPMSLYRHVGSKDELVVLMLDAATGLPPDLASGPGQWRAGLRQWALALRTAYLRRPWLVHVPIGGPPDGPNAIAWMDTCLRALRDTGLGWEAKVGAASLISGYVRSATQLTQDFAAARADDLDQEQVERHYGRAMAKLVDPDRFPDAAQLFAAAPFESPPPQPADNDFTFGLDVILDGVATAITAAGGDA